MSDQSLPSPPFINVPHIHNFRSVGPYPLSRKKRFRPGYLYRSANLTSITNSGLFILGTELRITTVFDLRSTPEINKARSVHSDASSSTSPTNLANKPSNADESELTGDSAPISISERIQYVHAPVFTAVDYSPESIALRFRDYTSLAGPVGFVNAYTEILEAGAGRRISKVQPDLNQAELAQPSETKPLESPLPDTDLDRNSVPDSNHQGSFTTLFKHVRDKPSEPFLVHCTAGKDRTGIIVALILALAGVAKEDIATEYALSEAGLVQWRVGARERLSVMLDGDKRGIENMLGCT